MSGLCVFVAQSYPTLCYPMDYLSLLAPLSMKFSRQGCFLQGDFLTILSSEHFPDLGIEPRSPALQAESLPSEPPRKPLICLNIVLNYFLLIVFRTT